MTNSGKTYTQDGTLTDPGIIPRTIDCIFRTLGQWHTDVRVKPTGHNGYALYSASQEDVEEGISYLHETTITAPLPPQQRKGIAFGRLNLIGKGPGAAKVHLELHDFLVANANDQPIVISIGDLKDIPAIADPVGAPFIGREPASRSYYVVFYFSEASLPPDMTYSVWMSACEIYDRHTINDLIADPNPPTGPTAGPAKKIHINSMGDPVGLVEVRIRNMNVRMPLGTLC